MTLTFQGRVEAIEQWGRKNLRVVRLRIAVHETFDQWVRIPSATLNTDDLVTVIVTTSKAE